MSNKNTAQAVWTQYESGRNYKQNIGLFKNYRMNEDFFIGKQWEGVNAPDLPKPVFNILKRPVNHMIAMIVSDDISISLSSYTHDEELDCIADAVAKDMLQIIEREKVKTKFRDLLRNALVDGDMCLYWWYDPMADTFQAVKGEIRCEIIENINTYFGNPYSCDVQSQPYIILAQRKNVGSVRAEARQNNLPESDIDLITADSDAYQSEADFDDALCTVLIKLWKDDDGKIHHQKSTQKVVFRPDTATEQNIYPIAWACCEKVKSSMHGQAVISGMIQNQIYINKQFAMMMECSERNAYPTKIYNAAKIPHWSNEIGKDIACQGPVDDSVFQSIRGGDFSGQVLDLTREIISMTKECVGMSDAAMGNIDKPDNTSAIIATSQASATPLQLTQLSFYQFVEDCAIIMLDMMIAYYGLHQTFTERKTENDTAVYEAVEIDYDKLKRNLLKLLVDVGSASYFSELVQYQTLENLWSAGILTDAELFVKNIPDANLRGKKEILESLRKAREQPMVDTAQPIEQQPLRSGVDFYNNVQTSTSAYHGGERTPYGE